MKIKPPIYLGIAILGAVSLIAGPSLIRKEIGLAIGFILIMFGLFGISRSSGAGKEIDSDNSDEN